MGVEEIKEISLGRLRAFFRNKNPDQLSAADVVRYFSLLYESMFHKPYVFDFKSEQTKKDLGQAKRLIKKYGGRKVINAIWFLLKDFGDKARIGWLFRYTKYFVSLDVNKNVLSDKDRYSW